ncbi:MAG: hypothetical protein KKD99_13505 [Proteobacteria bacterium]|nr:hypothetical protein [Pseudomonadota bacterium]
MSSNQDAKQKELAIPMTAIEVMNDLSIDAIYLLDLAYKGLLVPFIPPVLNTQWIMFYMNSRTESPERYLSRWRYRKSDVEEFKIKHKNSLEELRLSHGRYPTAPEPQNDTVPIPAAPVPVVTKSVDDYIKQRIDEGAEVREIACELCDKEGIFKLTYLEICRKLDLGKDLQADQIGAMKKRAERACKRGKAMLVKSGKRK